MEQKLIITLVRSPIGSIQRQRDTLTALGLRKLHHSVTKQDTPAIRGMLKKVEHMVNIEVEDS